MGQFFSNFRNDTTVPKLGFDLEKTTPFNEDQPLYETVSDKLLVPAPDLLAQLKGYTSSDAFKCAIQNATPENEEKAWQTVLPTVDMLRSFYQYTSELQDSLPRLLSVLCQDNTQFDRHPGLTKELALIFDFVFDFDYWKMRTPALLNNFAYYRRLLAGGRYHPSPITLPDDDGDSDADDRNDEKGDGVGHKKHGHTFVSDLRSAMQEDDQAHKITMFLAPSTPMMTTVMDVVTSYAGKPGAQKNVCHCLVALWAACVQNLADKKRVPDDHTTTCLKSMVIAIILFDHIDPQGAYYKQSPINMKTTLKLIQTSAHMTEETATDSLLSALRYNSKHLKDESTPKHVKSVLLSS